MNRPGLVPPLPGEHFVSQAEYLADADRNRAALDARRRAEARMAGHLASWPHEGTCAPCLRRAVFATAARPGRPNWAAGQACDCEDRLPASARVLLHAALGPGGLRPWSRLLLFGPEMPLHRRMRALAGETLHVADLTAADALEAAAASADLLIAADVLHRAASVPALLAAWRQAAAPAATLLASLPLHPDAPATLWRDGRAGTGRLSATATHAIGWDVLRLARDAGWARAEILRVWSRELGYLGEAHFLLRAVAPD